MELPVFEDAVHERRVERDRRDLACEVAVVAGDAIEGVLSASGLPCETLKTVGGSWPDCPAVDERFQQQCARLSAVVLGRRSHDELVRLLTSAEPYRVGLVVASSASVNHVPLMRALWSAAIVALHSITGPPQRSGVPALSGSKCPTD